MGWVDLKLAPRHAHLAKCLEDIGEDEDISYTSQGMNSFQICIIISPVQIWYAISSEKE